MKNSSSLHIVVCQFMRVIALQQVKIRHWQNRGNSIICT